MDITQELSNILRQHNGGAYLFIGSGLSRRYLGLEDWEGLLSKFCVDVKPFKFYKTTANGDLAETAKLLAFDFHEKWWEGEKYANNRKLYEKYLEDQTSALRIEISDYLKNINLDDALYLRDEKLTQEIDLLSKINLNGIITTNWDLFLEKIFPTYTKFIGQKELLFSNLMGTCEIYKIHGCATEPSSLILTSDDYMRFENRNSYLAAKLTTIFVENPIIFLGYSLTDKNICEILKSIIQCFDATDLEKLRQNLIFVQRIKNNESEQLVSSSINFVINDETVNLPIVLIKTDDFSKIYEATYQTHKNRFPVRLLRNLKEQVYELAFSNTIKEKIHVVDMDKIENYDDVEFVIGVGVKEQLGISEHGYSSIEINEIIDDVIELSSKFDAEKLLKIVIPKKFDRRKKYLPVFKYLQAIGVDSLQEYSEFKNRTGVDLDVLVFRSEDDLKNSNKSTISSFHRSKCVSMNDISNYPDVDKALLYVQYINFKSASDEDLESLRLFLDRNKRYLLDSNTMNVTAFKKAVVLYDKLKYGW